MPSLLKGLGWGTISIPDKLQITDTDELTELCAIDTKGHIKPKESGMTATISGAAAGRVDAAAVTFAKAFAAAPVVLCVVFDPSDATVAGYAMAKGVSTTGFTPTAVITTVSAASTVKIGWCAFGA